MDSPPSGDIATKTSVSVLTASLILGALFGLFVYPNWQVLLIPTKIMAGIVDFPGPNLPQYINMKSWNLLSQCLAPLMRHGWTDAQVSQLASVVQGMAALGGLSLLALAVTRSPLLSVAVGPAFLYLGLWSGGVAYPIHLIGFHSYGVVGFDFALLTAGLFVTRLYTPAAFLAGLLPCIHPSWGVWICTTLGLYLLIHFRTIQNKAAILGCLGLGAAASVGSYLYQAQFIPDMTALSEGLRIPGLTDKQYFMAQLHSWAGQHRSLGLWVYLHKGFAISLCGFLTSVLLLTSKRLNAGESLKRFAWFQAIFFSLTLCVSVFITLLPDAAPSILHVLMPNRFWCLSFVLTILTALTVGFAALNSRFLSIFLILAVGLLILQSHTKTHVMYFFLGPLMVLALAHRGTRPFASAPRLAAAASLLIYGAAAWAVLHIPLAAIHGQPLRYDGGNSIPMTPALEAVDRSGGTTALAPTVDYYLQMRLKAPVVFSQEMVAASYAAEILPLIDKVAEDIHGEGFIRPYLENRPPPDVWPNWTARSTQEWETLMKKYGIDTIIVRREDSLNLPLLAEDEKYRVYKRP